MKKMNAKRIAALIAIILLAALYVVTLIVAIFDQSASGNLFKICLICTVVVPVLAWIFIWIYGQMTGKKTIADLNLMQDSGQPQADGEKKEK
ncbi:MAG: hypothetical protein ACI4EQ_06760 [Lachnospiraceae bacterium]